MMIGEPRYLPNDNNWMVINRGIRYKITHDVVVMGLAVSSLYLVTQYIPLSEAEENDDGMKIQIAGALRTVNAGLQEHFIVAPDGFCSYRRNGTLEEAC